MMRMKKREGVIAAVVLILGALAVMWIYVERNDEMSGPPDTGNKGGQLASQQEDSQPPEDESCISQSNYSEEMPEVKFTDFQPIPRHWTRKHDSMHFENTRLRVSDLVGMRDRPAIDLHFRKPGPDGSMRPARIQRIDFWPIDPESKTRLKRIEPTEMHSMGYEDGLCWIRLSLFEDAVSDDYLGLKLGRTYYIQMWRDRWFRLKKQLQKGLKGRGSAIVTIPEQVPEGKVLVVKLDVTATDDEWRITEDMVPQKVTMKMPQYRNRSIAYFHYNPSTKHLYPSKIIRSKTVTWNPSSMKEEIGIFDIKRRYRLMYRGNLKKNLKFPRDATEVVKAEDVTRFQVRVPKDVPEDTISLCLLKGGDEHVPVALGRIPDHPDPDTIDIGGRKMEFYAPPGTYHVAYAIQDVGSVMKRFGMVTVPESADGKMLSIELDR